METQTALNLDHSSQLPSLESFDLKCQEALGNTDDTTKPFGLSINSKKISKKRSKYQRIDDSLRQKLIDAVIKDGQMLKAAAKKYKINYSSAKSIFHTYRKEGRINKKSVRDRYGRISFTSPSSTSSLKQINLSPIKVTKTEESIFNNHSAFLTKDIKMPQMKPLAIDPLSSTFINTLPSTNKIEYQLELEAKTAFSLQSFRLAQHAIQQANNIRFCQELSKLYNLATPALPTLFGRSALNTELNPLLNSLPSLMALQPGSLGLGSVGFQKPSLNGIMPLLQGYNKGLESLFSTPNIGK